MLSLIFWCLALIITVKYVGIVLEADNRGEGGILALSALLNRSASWRNSAILDRGTPSGSSLHRCFTAMR